jgi:hypothetical protein
MDYEKPWKTSAKIQSEHLPTTNRLKGMLTLETGHKQAPTSTK